MKVLMILISLWLAAGTTVRSGKNVESTKVNSSSVVSCFSKSSIKLYKTATADKPTDSLLSLAGEEHCWYIVDLSVNMNGRYKIKELVVRPSCLEMKLPKCKDRWIDKSSDLLIQSAYNVYNGDDSFSLYSVPDVNGKQTTVDEYYEFKFLDFKNKWMKVGYTKNGIWMEGWMKPGDECCAPWTTCPRVD